MHCTLLLYGRLLLPYIGPYPHRYIYYKKYNHYYIIVYMSTVIYCLFTSTLLHQKFQVQHKIPEVFQVFQVSGNPV